MKKTYFLKLLLFVCLTSMSVFAQNAPIYTSASGIKHNEMLANDPSYKAAFDAYVQSYNNYLKKNKGGRPAGVKATVTLPVVFHVVYPSGGAAPGTPFNPTDAQIDAALAFMNNSFNKTRAGTCGVDTEIQFAKAVRAPTCSATTGINRVSGSGVTNYDANGIQASSSGSGAVEGDVKALIKWDQRSYINIWIVNEIDGFDGYLGSGTAGYAYGPSIVTASNATQDGIVVLASQIINATSANPGRTLTHEMGHYLGLLHTFQGDGSGATCPPDATCTTQGDLVCDTEAYRRNDAAGISCPTPAATLNTCTGANFVVGADGCSVLNNYMSYSPNDCRNMFTTGQKNLMQSSVSSTGTRSSLVSSQALTPTITAPTAACTPTAPNGLGNAFGITNVTFNTLNVTSGASTVDGANYIDRTCTQATTIQAATAYIISITTLGGNSHCRKVYVDFNNDGDFLDAGEEIFSGTGAGTQTGSITLPNTTLPGKYRMRVVADFNTGSCAAITSCNLPGFAGFGSGQAEDFLLDVLNPLPVQLASFTGKSLPNRTVELNWETASEINASHFVVERSENLTSFEQVATVKANGNSIEKLVYNAIDKNPTAGVNYYRLTEHALNGATTAFKPIAVQVNPDNAGTLAYPNPSNGAVFVMLPIDSPNQQTFKWVDVLGVEHPVEVERTGLSIYKIKAKTQLLPGNYTLQVQNGSVVRNLKVSIN